jgi:hypothetical protein
MDLLLIKEIKAHIKSLSRIAKELSAKTNKQIQSIDEKDRIAAHIYSWFNNYRLLFATIVDAKDLNEMDEICEGILKSIEKDPSRKNVCDELLKIIKHYGGIISNKKYLAEGDKAERIPDFARIAADTTINQLLINRWNECNKCVYIHANLASIVMIGGLLEAIFLTKINNTQDKSKIFRSSKDPIDKKGKTLTLKEWSLQNYIEVAYDIGWIGFSIKDISHLLRDYRNYIHPYKELSNVILINDREIQFIWDISRRIIQELI